MKRASLLTIALVAAASLMPDRVWAGPYDALSETEISEMLKGEEAPENSYSNATPEPENVSRASEEDDDVDSELGQNGAMDALHESSRFEDSESRIDQQTPIPAAKPEPWMKKSSYKKKKVTKVAKKHHVKTKKAKKYSKKASLKKGKHVAAAKKRFARR